jgi:hypothetical protein
MESYNWEAHKYQNVQDLKQNSLSYQFLAGISKFAHTCIAKWAYIFILSFFKASSFYLTILPKLIQPTLLPKGNRSSFQ